MRKIKGLFLAAALTFFSVSAFAADATVTFVSGKVEVQRGGKWIALQKGDSVSKSETISTGFQSEAKIKMMDSVMYLGPVTRVTLEELSSSGQQDNVNVYLKTGSARSQVKHVDNKRVNYQVHTAVAVASCRGTDWIIDDSNNIICFDGIVAVAAYEPPADAFIDSQKANAGDKDESEGDAAEEGKSDEGKTDAASESESSSSSDSEKKSETSSSTSKTSTTKTASAPVVTETPTTKDGILVKANQSVTVSVTSAVSVPVNTVVTTVSNVTSAVKTAAAKEAVASVETNEAPPAVAVDETKAEPVTANVAISIEFED